MYNEESIFCDLDPEVLGNHYSTVADDPPPNIDFMKETKPAELLINTKRFTKKEISTRLKACEYTVSGPDGLTYNQLKQIDPDAIALTSFYNICLKLKAIQSSWKKTATILIYKKGSKQDLGNWCPIALWIQSTSCTPVTCPKGYINGLMIIKFYPLIKKVFCHTTGYLKTIIF